MWRIIAFYLILVPISGCSHLPLNHAKNIVAVNEIGKPQDAVSRKGVSRDDFKSRINNAIIEAKGKTILVYIHGGLNSEEESNDRAEIIAGVLEKETPQQYYPFFIHWKSGPFTSLGEHLFFDRQGTYWSFWGPVTSPFILLEDLGRGIVRAPMVWWYQTNSLMETLPGTKYWFPGQSNAADVNRLLRKDGNGGLMEIPNAASKDGLFEDPRSGGQIFGDGVLGGFKLVLGLTTAPVFDALGTGAWDNMKRRSDVAVFTSEYRSEKDRKYALSNVDRYVTNREGALFTFFSELAKAQNADHGLKIVIVGHSMGAIIASRMLSEFPDLNYERVVFMAAASRIEDFRSSVLPHLQKPGSATRFFNLMLHPIAENQEAHGFGLGGTGTLLNQIDSIYEDPVSEGKRTLGRYVNVMNNVNIFTDGISEKVKNRIYLRTMPLHCGYPQKHGEFAKVRKYKKGEPGYPGCLPFGPFWDEDFGKRDVSTPASKCVE